jgi:hypothetical protein
MVFLCIDYEGASKEYENVLSKANTVFVYIFLVECITKISGLGFVFYISDKGNVFDFVIVCGSLLGLMNNILPINITALRLMRVVRLLRLAKSSKTLQGLIKTLWMSAANISYVGLLILLLFFVFTLTGMDLFGKVTQGPDGFINDDCNF